MIEARLPQLPLFQGSKVPKVSSGANESVSLPLGPDFQKILVRAAVRYKLHDHDYIHDTFIARATLSAFTSTTTICSPAPCSLPS